RRGQSPRPGRCRPLSQSRFFLAADSWWLLADRHRTVRAVVAYVRNRIMARSGLVVARIACGIAGLPAPGIHHHLVQAQHGTPAEFALGFCGVGPAPGDVPRPTRCDPVWDGPSRGTL